MTRSSYIALCAALILTVVSAQVSNSLTSTAFAAAPGKVFDGTTTSGADVKTWGTYTSGITFGPGTTNSTVFAWGWTTASGKITALASRTLNATLLSNGTADATMASVIGSDAVYTTAITAANVQATVGLGTLGVAYVATDTATVPCSQVYVAVFTGGTAAPTTTKAVTSNVCTLCKTGDGATVGTGYTNSVNNIFYENSTFYVSYNSIKYTTTSATGYSDACTSAPTTTAAAVASSQSAVNGISYSYLQGLSTSGTAKWTTAAVLSTGTSTTGTVAAVYPSCNQGNWTNSTNFLCTYSSGSPSAISYLTVAVATGTAGSASTIATSVAAGTIPTTKTTYSAGGFVHSQYQQGILINNQVQTIPTGGSDGGSTSTYVNTLQFYNLTSGATATTGGVSLNITNTYSGGQYNGAGISFSSGWGLIDIVGTSGTNTIGEWSAWFANGTMNGTKSGFFSGGSGPAGYFVDANGAFWVGAYSTNADGSPSTGYLGKLIAQVYPNSGNILVTFFGLISLVIAALFVF